MYNSLRNIPIEAPIKHIGTTLETTNIPLSKLYQNGWWITEIFGSYANVVKISSCNTRKSKNPYFMCLSLLIDTTKINKTALKTIQKIKDAQWEKYKHLMIHQNETKTNCNTINDTKNKFSQNLKNSPKTQNGENTAHK